MPGKVCLMIIVLKSSGLRQQTIVINTTLILYGDGAIDSGG